METKDTSTVYSEMCPAREILERVADKWTTLVIRVLSDAKAPVRFGEFRRVIGGISQKMLTETLRDLERDGLVVRTAYPEIPPRVEYSLTPLGKTLRAPLGALAVWTEEHMAEVHRAQKAFDRRKRAVKGAALER